MALGAEAFAPDNHSDARQQADGDASARADPVIFKGVLQEKRNANQDGNDTDPIEPLLPNSGLQVGLLLLGSR